MVNYDYFFNANASANAWYWLGCFWQCSNSFLARFGVFFGMSEVFLAISEVFLAILGLFLASLSVESFCISFRTPSP